MLSWLIIAYFCIMYAGARILWEDLKEEKQKK